MIRIIKSLKLQWLIVSIVTKLDRDIFYKLLNSFACREKILIQIKGYSGLSVEEQKNILFSTFDDSDGVKIVPVNVLKDHLNNDEMFRTY